MTEEEKLIKAVESIILPLLKTHLDECVKPCPVSSEIASELGHLFGVMTDIGDGDMRKGIETIRTHNIFIKGILTTKGKVTTVITTSIVVSILSAFIALLGYTVKDAIQRLILGK